jgi:hypothetical protein
MEDVHSYFSKIAFLFLVFAVISGGYMSDILSCQMQKFLSTASASRHLVGILLIFVFIMLEGGWSFDTKLNDRAPNDWSSGNVIDTAAMALLIYVLFLLSSKMQFTPNVIFFLCLLLLYALNTQRSFYYARDMIEQKTNKTIVLLQYVLLALTAAVFVYGIGDYATYQMKEYGNDFSWFKFILGTEKCASLK